MRNYFVSLQRKIEIKQKRMLQIDELYNLFLQHPQVTTDSRDCPVDSIFFALKGDNFDGNAYAKQALESGCSYAVVDEPDYADSIDKRYLLVDDVLTTLQQLANYHRRQLGTIIIGVTGTNGKTTTKELISAVLSKKYQVLYTQGNFNNHIGVPKTLLRLTRQHEIAVIEMGANHPGEIKTLGELYDFLREHEGKIFINENNPHLMGIAGGLEQIPYGNNGELVDCSPYLRFNYKTEVVQTQLIGAYNLDNALAAACIGQYFEVSDTDICAALSEYKPTNNRSQLVKTARNTLIVDAYNANPTSMKAAIDNFRKMTMPNKMLIVGDMKELGEASHEEHVKILQQIYKCAFQLVWLVGEEFWKATVDIPDYSSSFIFFKNVEEVKQAIEKMEVDGHTILIKGSNSMKLYTLVDCL